MTQKIINVRVSEDEASILAEYAIQMNQSQSEVMRSYIRALEARITRVKPDTIDPSLLPSLPLTRRAAVPPMGAVYFFLSEGGDVLYVGQCANMTMRLTGHHKYEAAIETDPHARIHWLEKGRGREAFEKACIRRFNPPLNGSVEGHTRADRGNKSRKT